MTDQRDVAAQLGGLVRALIAAERPVLAKHGISMWGYSVLITLDGNPAPTQAALAEQIGADKTRIIGTLDTLQEAGFITREPDPDDQRARLLNITHAGREVRKAAQSEIQANERRLLNTLPAADRRGFLRALEQLSSQIAG